MIRFLALDSVACLEVIKLIESPYNRIDICWLYKLEQFKKMGISYVSALYVLKKCGISLDKEYLKVVDTEPVRIRHNKLVQLLKEKSTLLPVPANIEDTISGTLLMQW